MSQQGILQDQTSGSMDIETLSGDTGGAVGPDGAFNVNLLGGDTLTVDGNPGTNTLALNASVSGYPITPYVVGPDGGYATIQDGLDAANAAGGGIVGVQPGTYTEDLTLYDNTQVVGFGTNVPISAGSGGWGQIVIDGTHSLPTTPSGATFGFKNVVLTNSGDVITSSAAIAINLVIDSCVIGNISGYLVTTATSSLNVLMINTTNPGTGNRGIDILTGLNIYNSQYGSYGATVAAKEMSVRAINTEFQCPLQYDGASDFYGYGCNFFDSVTIDDSSEFVAYESYFQNDLGSPIVWNSSDNMQLLGCVINGGSPAIDGTGAGQVSLTGVDFVSNSTFGGSLTVLGSTSYSGNYKSDYTDHGVILGQGTATNMVATSAGTDGQVLLGATSADPAFATLTSTGSTITFTPGANSLNLETGSAVSSSFPTDSGTAIPAAGALTIVGTGGITTSGTGSTVTLNGSGEQVITITALDNTDSPYTVLTTDYYMSCDVSGGVLTIRMPNAPTTGKVFIVKDSGGDAATSNITVTTVGGVVTIDGSTSYVMNVDYQSAQFVFNGTSYEVF